MANFPMSWHRECLENEQHSLQRAEAELARMAERVARQRQRCEHRQQQIAEAERLGKAGFDPDKFHVKSKQP